MKQTYLRIIALGLFLCTAASTSATHIVGAELFYECINPNSNQYRLTLKLYRDCLNGEADFDNPIFLFVFSTTTGQLLQDIAINFPGATNLEPENIDACVARPPRICVEEGVYETIVTLPPRRGGYHLAWARCCRNARIDNLFDPLGEGVSFLAEIPDPEVAECNSMPKFKQVPPVFLCVNEPFTFDHSATDEDGDSLTYALTDPYTGLNLAGRGAGNPQRGGPDPVVSPNGNPMGPPPYRNVRFDTGFGFLDPFGSRNFDLDPETGFIRVTPNQLGVFVYSVSVFEWRDGILISENRRDYQIEIIPCLPQDDPPVISHDLQNLNSSNDTIFVNAAEPFCYDFTVRDTNVMDQLEVFTVSSAFGNGNFTRPPATLSFAGINPILGQVCWQPSCVLDGQVIPLIIGAGDIGDCPNISNVFDTVYVNIVAPPNEPPVIRPDTIGFTKDADTLIWVADDDFCLDVAITDPNFGDQLVSVSAGDIFDSANPPTYEVTGSNPLAGQICWKPSCDLKDEVVEIKLTASDISACGISLPVEELLYIRIIAPDNVAPEIKTDLSGNAFSNDTIFVEAQSDLCYSFEMTDANMEDIVKATIVQEDGMGPNAPAFNFSGTNPVIGEVCWTPDCDFSGQTVKIIMEAEDRGFCDNNAKAVDTIYVSIEAPPNLAPTATHDLVGLNTVNDTIFINAEEQLCYDVFFNDLDALDTLDVEAISPIFANGGANYTISGTNPVQVQVCWVPDCDFDGQLVPLILEAKDQDVCNNILSASDTVFVKIDVPESIPPNIIQDLTGTDNRNDTVFINVGEGFCYDFSIEDLTLASDFGYDFEFQSLSGEDAGLGTVDVVRNGPRIDGKVCFQSDCTNGGSTYRLVIIGQDERLCPPLTESRDTVFVRVFTDFDSETGPDISFCEGTGGTRLSVAPQGGSAPYFYEWGCTDPPNCGINDPNAASPTVNPTGSTTYFVQLTDRFGCTSEFDSVDIEVKALPIVNAGPDQSICDAGDAVQLEVEVLNAAEAGGSFTYEWFPAANLDDPMSPTPMANPEQSTIYTVLVNGANGCSSLSTTLDTAASVTVRVSERPLVQAGDNRVVCFGDSVQITGFATGGGPLYSYTWESADGSFSSNDQSPWVSPGMSATYILRASTNGCDGPPDSLQVAVLALPESNLSPQMELCANDSIQLNGTAIGSGQDFSYSWSPARGLDDPTSPTPFTSPDTNTSYSLVITSEDGCNSNPYTIEVISKPTPVASAGDDLAICRADSVELSGSHTFFGTLPPSGSPIYQWTPGASLDDPNSPDPMASPASTELYTLVVSYGDCQSTDQVKVDVFNQISIDLSFADTLVCEGTSLFLDASSGLGDAIYSWTPAESLDDPSSGSPIASPTESTVYQVNIERGGCVATDSIRIDVIAGPLPGFLVSNDAGCAPHDVAFIANEDNAISYNWSFSDTTGTFDSFQSNRRFEEPGTYMVSLEVEDANGCTSVSTEEISVFGNVIADFTSDPGFVENIFLPDADINFTNTSQNALSYGWDFGNGIVSTETNPSISFSEPGTYTVGLLAVGENGCNDRMEVSFTILSPDLFIPNVFSPNQDGINDSFKVQYQGGENFILEVFDRWGRKMFEDRNPDSGWDGTVPGGNPAGAGVYYYQLSIGTKNYTGSLTLVR